MKTSQNNVNPSEVKKFSSMASHWWDEEGEFKTLHQINPIRVDLVNETVSLADKKVLDVGCGGGILSEAMAQKGADVTGIDMGKELIDIAELHSLDAGVAVNYKQMPVEELAEEQQANFDCITCMEMLEHVPDPLSVIKACASLVKEDGYVFFSTLNRTPKSYLFSIVGAEYVLGMLPKGTHDYKSFIKPSELASWARQSGLELVDCKGIVYNPLTKNFSQSEDVSINYISVFKKIS